MNKVTYSTNTFNTDTYPGGEKILFIGLAQSSHTHSWINLLEEREFNIRLFAVPPVPVPSDNWKIHTYLSTFNSPNGLNPALYQSLYANQEIYNFLISKHPLLFPVRLFNKIYTLLAPQSNFPESVLFTLSKAFPFLIKDKDIKKFRSYYYLSPNESGKRPDSPEAWLAEIINTWQRDIIDTLGMDHHQGGFFFNEVRKKYQLNKTWKWVVQTRGGSDLELNRFEPAKVVQIKEIFETCDRIISDNTVNIEYAAEMGICRDKFAPLTPVPGTGGIDVESFAAARQTPPSQRERIILWPKAYDSQWSLALPVFEALKNCWSQIQPCKIYMLAMDTPSTRDWSRSLPPEILQNCVIHNRLPRQEALDLMARARILLIPSLVDGIPNSLYEAMASGTFPIVSPLNTISTCVSEPHNVLFARNLYPAEIAQALIHAMSDDALVDAAAQNNLEKVRQIADRETIRQRVVAFYQSLL